MTSLDPICYEKNFLKDVIFRIDYSSILKISESVPSGFQETIRQEFPVFEERKLNKYYAVIEKNVKKEEHLTVVPEWNFFNKEKTLRLAFTADYLFVQLSMYDTYAGLKAIIEKISSNFISFYSPLTIERLGLRYVNEITLEQGDPFEWSTYLNVPILQLIGEFFENKSQISRSVAQTILNKDDHSMTFTYGMYNKSEFPAKISRKEFLLDFDCYTQHVPESEILKFIQVFHSDIQSLFEACIKDDLRQIMGVKNVQRTS